MPDEIVFEPLPTVIGRGDRHVLPREFGSVLPTLRQKPNAWARVKTLGTGRAAKQKATQWASIINRGKSPTFGTDYAAVTRTLKDGTVALYMRYVGEETPE